MIKVVFKCCFSGNTFFKKGDTASLEDSEALRLKERDIVDFLEEKTKGKEVKKAKE